MKEISERQRDFVSEVSDEAPVEVVKLLLGGQKELPDFQVAKVMIEGVFPFVPFFYVRGTHSVG